MKNIFINHRSRLFFEIFVAISLSIFTAYLIDSKIDSEFGIIIAIFLSLFSIVLVTVIEIKFKLDELIKKKHIVDEVINKCHSFGLLSKGFVSSVGPILEFNSEYSKHNKHTFISNFKTNKLLEDYFIFSIKENSIKRIPDNYFLLHIWTWFVNNSKKYYSVQELNTKHISYYLSNKKRQLREINTIKHNKDLDFKKIFVVDIWPLTEETKEYLEYWRKKVGDDCIGIIESSDIVGKLIDMAIFNDCFCKQDVVNTIDYDELLFSVYFDLDKREEYENNFNIIFDKVKANTDDILKKMTHNAVENP